MTDAELIAAAKGKTQVTDARALTGLDCLFFGRFVHAGNRSQWPWRGTGSTKQILPPSFPDIQAGGCLLGHLDPSAAGYSGTAETVTSQITWWGPAWWMRRGASNGFGIEGWCDVDYVTLPPYIGPDGSLTTAPRRFTGSLALFGYTQPMDPDAPGYNGEPVSGEFDTHFLGGGRPSRGNKVAGHWRVEWGNVPPAPDGPRRLFVSATDALGNVVEETITVSGVNQNDAPFIYGTTHTLPSPPNGSPVVNQLVSITARFL